MTHSQLEELLKSLTLKEKVGQLFQGNGTLINEEGAVTGALNNEYSDESINNMGSILNIFGKERIKKVQAEHLKHNKIPLMFMADIIFGYKNILPIALGQACSFDMDLIERGARNTASEAVIDGINVTFSPMVDISRDARWGRCCEGYGEDPLLGSRCAVAMVKGYQGDDLSADDTLMSCVKHFAAYGATSDGTDYNGVEMNEHMLREVYLKNYEAAVKAGAGMMMSSFNTINGVPATQCHWLLDGILRGEWGFDGVLISDYGSIWQALNHGSVNSEEELCEQALVKSKIDIDMMDYIYNNHIEKLVLNGTIPESAVDECVMRVLECKNKLGLLDDPYKYVNESKPDLNDYEASYENAVNTVCESSVLLKNDGVLPLDKSQKAALIGPYSLIDDMAASWAKIVPNYNKSKTIYECMKKIAGESVLDAELGSPILSLDEIVDDGAEKKDPVLGNEAEYLEKAINAAKSADVVVMPIGESFLQSGESRSRANLTVPEVQMNLFRRIYEVNQNIVVVLFTGRPLDISELSQKAKAVLCVWLPGTGGGEAIADMIYGNRVPSGKLSMCFPRTSAQAPIYYSKLPTGHPNQRGRRSNYDHRWIDCELSPLYPFGFGLTYTDFEYSNLTLSSTEMTKDGIINVSVDVKNNGKFDGDEVVQLYIRDRFASYISRPVKELKDFKRVHVKSGETVTVNFEICEEMLRFYNIENKLISEPGEFHLFVGSSSADESLGKQTFYLK